MWNQMTKALKRDEINEGCIDSKFKQLEDSWIHFLITVIDNLTYYSQEY